MDPSLARIVTPRLLGRDNLEDECITAHNPEQKKRRLDQAFCFVGGRKVIILHNLARLYGAQGRYAEAWPLYQRNFVPSKKKRWARTAPKRSAALLRSPIQKIHRRLAITYGFGSFEYAIA